MWNKYINATNLDDVLDILGQYGDRARIVAGGTDILIEFERGVRKPVEILIDITRITELDQIILGEDNKIHLGPLVTHNHCVASKLILEYAFPLAQAAWLVGAPQIRNRGTIAGNLITASPANDTITPLMALGAKIKLKSSRGERILPLEDFYRGVRKTVMRPDEMLVDIFFDALENENKGVFLKLGLRQAQAISVVNVAIILSLTGIEVKNASITLGAVAPQIIHAKDAENYLNGKVLNEEVIHHAAHLAMSNSSPIDDIRGSAAYRREMIRVLTARGLKAILNDREREHFPAAPVMLSDRENCGGMAYLPNPSSLVDGSKIVTRVNGKILTLEAGLEKSLLDLLRDSAGLTGSKEGCGEGECGACTVFLDGMAVMSCLVPAPRAHGAEIVTIEGLSKADRLHPVQEAFVHAGAVQCGYCTPGFLMSAAMLLEEVPHPSRDQIKQAITGNLCRCTGYYKIIDAIEKASQMEVSDG
jgi:carbon-monoxide dehydrogenase medium subunit